MYIVAPLPYYHTRGEILLYPLLDFDLSFNGIISFLKAEDFSASDSETLGVHLKVPRPDINTMKKDNVGDAMCLFYKIIETWLRLSEPSTKELAEALERSGYKRIARKLRGEIKIAIWCLSCSFLDLWCSIQGDSFFTLHIL